MYLLRKRPPKMVLQNVVHWKWHILGLVVKNWEPVIPKRSGIWIFCLWPHPRNHNSYPWAELKQNPRCMVNSLPVLAWNDPSTHQIRWGDLVLLRVQSSTLWQDYKVLSLHRLLPHKCSYIPPFNIHPRDWPTKQIRWEVILPFKF